jgi:hypothetical protein
MDTCQLMDAVDNLIPFWATSHRDLGCPRATLPILDFRIPVPGGALLLKGFKSTFCIQFWPPGGQVKNQIRLILCLVGHVTKEGPDSLDLYPVRRALALTYVLHVTIVAVMMIFCIILQIHIGSPLCQ